MKEFLHCILVKGVKELSKINDSLDARMDDQFVAPVVSRVYYQLVQPDSCHCFQILKTSHHIVS